MKSIAILITLVGLAACSNSEVLATPTGSVFPLNTGHWQPTASDLQVPKIGRPG
jgi:hypothetical protein